jgi:hypothetical protein
MLGAGNVAAGIGYAGERWNRLTIPVRVAVGVTVVLAAVGVQLFRQAGEPAWKTIWAEDGWQFLQDAVSKPFGDTVFDGVAGYAHLVPRLIAAVVEPLPVSAWPVAITVICAVLTMLLALYVYAASVRVIPPARRRALLALAVVLLPVAVQEAALDLANLRLYFDFAALIAFLDLRPTRLRLAAGAVVVVAATLSDPLPLLLFPLAIWRLARARGPLDTVVPCAFALAAAGQLWVIVHSPDPEWADSGFRRETISLYGYRVLAELLFGERFYADVVSGIGGLAVLTLVFALLAVVVVSRWLRQSRGERGSVAVFLVASVAAWIAPLVQRGVGVLLPVLNADGAANLSSPRYSVVPMLCLIAALLVPATGAATRHPRALAATALLAACWFTVLIGVNYRWTTPRSPAPSFQSWVDEREVECQANPAGEAVLPIHPTPETGPWQIVVPCSRLTQ